MIQTIVNDFIQIILYLVVIPSILGTLLVIINHNNKQKIVNILGFRAQVFGAFIGIIIHELSHLLMALVFRHKITSFRLVRLPSRKDPDDNSLGYVNHSWNERSVYQQVGNVFIGVAPIIGNTLAILALTQWLLPQVVATFESSGDFLDVSLLSGAPFGFWGLLIWVILCSNICTGGFDLSSADIKNARIGIVGFLIILVVISIPIGLFGWSLDGFKQFMIIIYSAMAFALVVSLLTNAAIRLLGRFKTSRATSRPRHLG
ncbi:hypothetical protein ABTQ33_02360 [Paucilactobacillus suebicus]|uniref:Uncharacterized protein n=1 Tax=Paucilactobacillus suebicus DSM 5007 = KCTC 3549 TaxID=1423807 RepID=A0A0R1VX23_9LACO|nr:hypothetical protein [Paucilactobacillus suebicus]KRM10225.1 hypothetical protein FD16_GL001429 [Paucilactobacillus suebicus DSM 5007 = KCTC 3549]